MLFLCKPLSFTFLVFVVVIFQKIISHCYDINKVFRKLLFSGVYDTNLQVTILYFST